MKEVVFLHKVPIGTLSPAKAKQRLAEYYENMSIDLKSAHVVNRIVPIRDSENSDISLLYSSVDDVKENSSYHYTERHDRRSDILLDKLLSNHTHHHLCCGIEINQSFILDLCLLKRQITDQISEKEFYELFGYEDSMIPIGIVNDEKFSIAYYVNFEKAHMISKLLKTSEYLKYQSLVQLNIEIGKETTYV